MTSIEPTFAPLVSACAAFGIGRTTAFELAKSGDVETFTIGTRRFVVLESLRTLPDRLRATSEPVTPVTQPATAAATPATAPRYTA